MPNKSPHQQKTAEDFEWTVSEALASRWPGDVLTIPQANIEIGKSKVHGRGVLATTDLIKDQTVCIAIIQRDDGLFRTPAGRYINHSTTPNVRLQIFGQVGVLRAEQDIANGQELTMDYRSLKKLKTADAQDYIGAAAGGLGAGSLPVSALLGDIRVSRKAERAIAEAKEYKQPSRLAAKIRAGDIGLSGVNQYSTGELGRLQRGAVWSSGTPMYHGIAYAGDPANRKSVWRVDSGGGNHGVHKEFNKYTEGDKNPLNQLARLFSRDTLRNPARVPRSVADALRAAWQAGQEQQDAVERFKKVPQGQLERHLRNKSLQLVAPESSLVVLRRKGKKLTGDELRAFNRAVVTGGAFSPYSVPKAMGAAARNLVLPVGLQNLFARKANAPCIGAHCAVAPVSALQAIGVMPKDRHATAHLPANILRNLDQLEIVGVKGKEELLKKFMLARRARTLLGLGVAAPVAAAGAGIGHLTQKGVEGIANLFKGDKVAHVTQKQAFATAAVRVARQLESLRQASQPSALDKLRVVFGGTKALNRAAASGDAGVRQSAMLKDVGSRLDEAKHLRQYVTDQLKNKKMLESRRRDQIASTGKHLEDGAKQLQEQFKATPYQKVIDENVKNLKRFRTNSRVGIGAGVGGAGAWGMTQPAQTI